MKYLKKYTSPNPYDIKNIKNKPCVVLDNSEIHYIKAVEKCLYRLLMFDMGNANIPIKMDIDLNNISDIIVTPDMIPDTSSDNIGILIVSDKSKEEIPDYSFIVTVNFTDGEHVKTLFDQTCESRILNNEFEEYALMANFIPELGEYSGKYSYNGYEIQDIYKFTYNGVKYRPTGLMTTAYNNEDYYNSGDRTNTSRYTRYVNESDENDVLWLSYDDDNTILLNHKDGDVLSDIAVYRLTNMEEKNHISYYISEVISPVTIKVKIDEEVDYND